MAQSTGLELYNFKIFSVYGVPIKNMRHTGISIGLLVILFSFLKNSAGGFAYVAISFECRAAKWYKLALQGAFVIVHNHDY